jgi:hypothetical protein
LVSQHRCSQGEPWSHSVRQQNQVVTTPLLILSTPQGAQAGTGRIGPAACQSSFGE